jgi:hypothetical protein
MLSRWKKSNRAPPTETKIPKLNPPATHVSYQAMQHLVELKDTQSESDHR